MVGNEDDCSPEGLYRCHKERKDLNTGHNQHSMRLMEVDDLSEKKISFAVTQT